jgi:hypothetical protein
MPLFWNHPEITAERIFLDPVDDQTYVWFHGGDYEEHFLIGCDAL